MANLNDPRRKQLLYRAMHRGFKEADIIIGRFAQAHLADMSADEVEEFAELLEVPDQHLYAWIIGREPPPPNWEGPLLEQLRAFDVVSTMGKV